MGLLGGRQLPDWLLVHLRYVGVAVLPALVTPMILWPASHAGQFDPLRMVAAMAALAAGWRLGVIWAIGVGMGSLWLLQWVLADFILAQIPAPQARRQRRRSAQRDEGRSAP